MMNLFQVLRNKIGGEDYTRRRLEKIKATVASIPEGAHLLKLAKAIGVEIKMYPLGKKFRALGMYDHNNLDVWLDQNTSTKRLVKVLFHELRHMWQDTGMEHWEKVKRLGPGAAVGYVRLMEGDAFAFEQAMGLRLKGKEVTPETYSEFFWKFQRSMRAIAYGGEAARRFNAAAKKRLKGTSEERELAARRLKEEFNVMSIGELGGAEGAPSAGLDAKAPPYIAFASAQELQDKILEKTSTLEKLLAVAYHQAIHEAPEGREKRKRRPVGKVLKHLKEVSKAGPEVFDNPAPKLFL